MYMNAFLVKKMADESVTRQVENELKMMDANIKLINKQIEKKAYAGYYRLDEVKLVPEKQMVEHYKSLGFEVREGLCSGYFTILWE